MWCAADYAGPVRGAVLALKELGRVDAARALAPLLRAAVAGSLAAALAADTAREVPPVDSAPPPARRIELAPIPSTRRALARRGYDPVRLVLARTRLPRSPVLVVRRGWAAGAQKRRRRDARLAAQVDRFRTRGRLDGRAFIVVDDVATTGATLSSACTAIRRAGGTVLGCAVIAAPSFESRVSPEMEVIVHSPEGSR